MARKKSAAKRAREAAVVKDVQENGSSKQETKETAKPEEKKVSFSDSESESESSSEDEDELGDLITEDVEAGINNVLQAIKENPTKLLDPNVKFFEDPENFTETATKKEKPLYLKDYHRQNLLSGGYKDEDEDNEYGTIDGEKPFVVTQREERDQLLADIKSAFNEEEDEEDDDEDFLKKKEEAANHIHPDRQVTRLPDPNENEQGFLEAFVNDRAWIPKKNDKVINLDRIDQNDEEDFDDAVEKFEHAYNFRYEDANSAEIVSYARNQATIRRSATNSRKRQREKQQEVKEQENNEKEALLKKKKTTKLNKVMDRLQKIKEAVGGEMKDEVIEKVFGDSLLKEDFDDADWDNKMAEIFNEQYYGDENEKPVWDEDDEIMADFHKGDDNDEDDGPEVDEEEEEADQEQEKTKKKSKKDKLKEKKSVKKDKESLRVKAQEIVEANTHVLIDEVEEERGRSKGKEDLLFKYREVSPESFGLTTREILLADDKQLNTFIGIKKFAPYRPKESRMKDKRKYTKKKQLQEWRKEVFKDKNGPAAPEDDKYDIWIPTEEEETRKKAHKDKSHKKHKSKSK
ncbi:hypothetical protein G9P44_006129 [Scheffersomyces stipitis]|nr:hypothetical protein G9P44_006129 [Scheffersomyces stipitis]